jgi:hypothetical protein
VLDLLEQLRLGVKEAVGPEQVPLVLSIAAPVRVYQTERVPLFYYALPIRRFHGLQYNVVCHFILFGLTTLGRISDMAMDGQK